jgi:hypothetical protein
MRQLVYNAVKCLKCNKTIVSYNRHDYKECGCSNRAMVDGGTDYERYGAKVLDFIEKISVYDDEPFEKVRQYAYRGSRGEDGKQPLTYISLCDMELDHLYAVLDYGGVQWHLDLIKKEIEFKEKQIC